MAARYQARRRPEVGHWRSEAPRDALPGGSAFLIEVPKPFTLHCFAEGWEGNDHRVLLSAHPESRPI